jgi:hypothetical protein
MQVGGNVHNSNIYFLGDNPSPEQRFEVALRYLENGVPSRARANIEDAQAYGLDTGEVQFYWVLALLSKRSLRDLSAEERGALDTAAGKVASCQDDEWRQALEFIFRRVRPLKKLRRDEADAKAELRKLSSRPRAELIRHLDLVLSGEMRDDVWAGKLSQAEEDRLSHDRRGRVWAYFHPEPFRPRPRRPEDCATTAWDWTHAVAWTIGFVAAAGWLGRLDFDRLNPFTVLGYLMWIAAVCVAAPAGTEWRIRAARLAAREREHRGRVLLNRSVEPGFAHDVSSAFDHYSWKYAPKGPDGETWFRETAGIRQTLRDEIARTYRESEVQVDRVNWLIAYLIRDVLARWRDGSLWSYRDRYRVSPALALTCVVSSLVLLTAMAEVAMAGFAAGPVTSAAAFVVVVVSGPAAVREWFRITLERRRLSEEREEYEVADAARLAEYQKWKARLDSTRPSETEMETWLNCDKTVFVGEALRHYKLAWRNIIAHAVLQTPADHARRAREQGGAWRYSKYAIRLFLITVAGVREVSTEINFKNIEVSGLERNNFRFDAVSSVYVAKASDYSYKLQLTLTNGPTRDIRVTDPNPEAGVSEEDPETFSKINLDAAGFGHALHILEGIAAEGRGWIGSDSA